MRCTPLAGCLLLASCFIEPVDVEGRLCPCAPGWTCDTLSGRCAPNPDAGADGGRDGGASDAPDGALGPDAGHATFLPPTVEASLSSASNDQDPTLPEDELEIFFTSNRSGNEEVWTSRRGSLAGAWDPPTQVLPLAGPSVETDPEISSDGLHLFFTSNRSGDQDLWESTRPSRGGAWAAPIRVVSLSSADEDCCASSSTDGLRLVFASARLGAGMDVFVASRTALAAPWASIAPVASIDTPRAESNPAWTADELWLFFDSDRPAGMGGRDIYFATRAARSDPFGAASSVPELSSAFDDRDVWVSADGTHVWLSNDASGDYDLYTSNAP